MISAPHSEQLARISEPPLLDSKRAEPFVQNYKIVSRESVKVEKAAPWRERRRSGRKHGVDIASSKLKKKEVLRSRGVASRESLPGRRRRKRGPVRGRKDFMRTWKV